MNIAKHEGRDIVLKRTGLILIVLSIGFVFPLRAQTIIPEPLEMIHDEGTFTFNSETIVVYNTEAITNEVNYLTNMFRTTLGFILKTSEQPVNLNFVQMTLNPELSTLGNEGYHLNIYKTHIEITAAQPVGLFYACQTIKQLLPAEIDGVYPFETLNSTIPCLKIKDIPRFSYRGYMLDVSRYFIPINAMEKLLNAMAFYKMNTFHWHLTDYQGWRLQINQYPKLTLKGAKVEQTKLRFKDNEEIEDRIPSVGFYTQQEVSEFIEYANKLHIRIIPEIDVPAHSIAAISAYPFLSCSGLPQQVKQEKVGAMATVFCPGKESTFEFLENVFDEVMTLFPEQKIHIGADEVEKEEWEKCPHCKKRMEQESLETLDDLQSYFVKRVGTYLNQHNHNIIGWDEILEGGLAPNATVMSWRGMNGGIKAAKMGHQVIMTPTQFCYFDYVQGKDRTKEPYVRFKNYLPLSKVYTFDPVPSELNDQEGKLVLGAQANMWTNFVKSSSHVEYMTFPRLCAIAELTWSSKSNKDYIKFEKKLEAHYPRFEQRHIAYRKPPQE